MKKKKQKLADFVKLHGIMQAGVLCGVSAVTLWRWGTGKTKPEGNDARRLAELGVEVSRGK